MAKKLVENENETGKLFVSLLEINDLNDCAEIERRKIWTHMHQLSNDPFIHYMDIRQMVGSNAGKITELKNLIDFCEENDFKYTGTAANNMLAYLLKREGDLKGGFEAVNECLKLHPEGYNPMDSRSEFYLYDGDTAQAIKTYRKVLERFPFAQGAQKKLQELGAEEKFQ